jgi:DNA invertase Pin-like site-specific DNA recombinase
MKAALYARFSSDLQRATSIEDQFRNCRKRAELEGWAVVATYADAAMSGTDANRPQYRAMLITVGGVCDATCGPADGRRRRNRWSG